MAASGKPHRSDDEFLECGLCFENNNLKRMPCSPGHIFCESCLLKAFEVTKVVKCAVCSLVFDEAVEALPYADAPLDKFLCCDVCLRKDEKLTLAQIYCVICQKKFCKPHMDSHNDALDDHRRITMDEYKKEYRKVEIRNCELHKDQVYSVACEECHDVFCAKCMIKPTLCKDGKPHTLVDIPIYVAEFLQKINDKKLWVFDKEEHLLGIVKQLTRILSDWDGDTEASVIKLHEARDRHLERVKKKYVDLEQSFRELRGQSHDELTQYLDGEVGTQLDKLTRGTKKLDARIFTHHQVDIIREMRDTETFTDQLTSADVPKYKGSINHVILVDRGEDIDTETLIEIQTDDFTLPEIEGSENLMQHVKTETAPTSMQLTKRIELECCYHESVYHFRGYTYIGRGNAVDRISEDYQVESSFIELDYGFYIYVPVTVTVHNDLFYVLSGNAYRGYKVTIHDLAGRRLRSWEAKGIEAFYSKLLFIGQNIVIADPRRGQLILYNPSGVELNRISIDIDDPDSKRIEHFGLALVDESSLIVTATDYAKVLRIDIDSGMVMWTSSHLKNPQGVACYKNKYVLVTNYSEGTNIQILDINTGEFVGELLGEATDATEKASHLDMHIQEDTVIIINGKREVEFYHLT